MLDKCNIVVHSNGEAKVLGVEQGEAKVHRITANGLLVLKVKGGSYWAGRGLPRGYAGAEFQLYRVVKVASTKFESHGSIAYMWTLRCESIADIPLKNEMPAGYIDSVLGGLEKGDDES